MGDLTKAVWSKFSLLLIVQECATPNLMGPRKLSIDSTQVSTSQHKSSLHKCKTSLHNQQPIKLSIAKSPEGCIKDDSAIWQSLWKIARLSASPPLPRSKSLHRPLGHAGKMATESTLQDTEKAPLIGSVGGEIA